MRCKLKPMKVKVMIGVAIMTLLAACGPDGNSFRIRGSFRDMQAGELYIYNLSGDNARLDTLTIQGGKFRYRGETDEVTPFMLVFPNGVEQVIFAGPGDDIEYEATANDLKNYVVSGSEENELMNRFREETYTKNPSLTTNTARTYIKDNPVSPVALYLFDQYFAQNEEVGNAELKELLKVLKAKHPHHHALLDIESKLANADRREVGKKLPDASLTRKDRKTVKLWQSTKDYNLIAFWATWMPNGTDFLWRLRNTLRDNQLDGGKLRVVAVSLDVEPFRWEDAIRPDTTLTTIEHYCDGQGFESKAIKLLGINTVPYYILTDRKHQVVDCGDNVDKLAEMLKKYIR